MRTPGGRIASALRLGGSPARRGKRCALRAPPTPGARSSIRTIPEWMLVACSTSRTAATSPVCSIQSTSMSLIASAAPLTTSAAGSCFRQRSVLVGSEASFEAIQTRNPSASSQVPQATLNLGMCLVRLAGGSDCLQGRGRLRAHVLEIRTPPLHPLMWRWRPATVRHICAQATTRLSQA